MNLILLSEIFNRVIFPLFGIISSNLRSVNMDFYKVNKVCDFRFLKVIHHLQLRIVYKMLHAVIHENLIESAS